MSEMTEGCWGRVHTDLNREIQRLENLAEHLPRGKRQEALDIVDSLRTLSEDILNGCYE